MSETTIRPAGETDLDGVIELWKEFMDFHRARDAMFVRSAEGHVRFRAYAKGRLADPRARLLVADHDGRLVGYCLATIERFPPVFEAQEYGLVNDMAVTADFRRRGIAARLYEEARRWFREQAVRRIELRVLVSNEASTAFWREMGFRPYLEVLRLVDNPP